MHCSKACCSQPLGCARSDIFAPYPELSAMRPAMDKIPISRHANPTAPLRGERPPAGGLGAALGAAPRRLDQSHLPLAPKQGTEPGCASDVRLNSLALRSLWPAALPARRK